MSVNKELIDNCDRYGSIQEVRRIIKENSPDLDINHKSSEYILCPTPLHRACYNGLSDIIKVLLSHPKIDVNPVNILWNTPLACSIIQWGLQEDPVTILLSDKRVNVNEGAFMKACYTESRDLIEKFMIHRDDLVVTKECIKELEEHVPESKELKDVIKLVWSYHKDKYMIKRILFEENVMFEDYGPQHLLILGTLLEEGYYMHSEDSLVPKRFWEILKKLPAELRMVLCNRAFGQTKDFIPSLNLKTELRYLIKFKGLYFFSGTKNECFACCYCEWGHGRIQENHCL